MLTVHASAPSGTLSVEIRRRPGVGPAVRAARFQPLMGSLIKKRRKRMRKKKHRKLLKRTRVQRRNKK